EFSFQTEEAEIGSQKTLTIRWTGAAAAAKTKKKDDPWAAKSLRLLHQTILNVLVDHGSQQRPFPNGPTVKAVDLESSAQNSAKAIPPPATKQQRRKPEEKHSVAQSELQIINASSALGIFRA